MVFFNCVLNANNVSQVLFRIFHSSCLTNVMTSKQWFSNFSHHGILCFRLGLVDHCPQEPSTALICHCCSSALLSLSLVPAPSCKPPWPLFLTPLVIFSPRSLWLAAVGDSKWLGGPSISTACGDFALGLEGWGRTAGAWGAQC